MSSVSDAAGCPDFVHALLPLVLLRGSSVPDLKVFNGSSGPIDAPLTKIPADLVVFF